MRAPEFWPRYCSRIAASGKAPTCSCRLASAFSSAASSARLASRARLAAAAASSAVCSWPMTILSSASWTPLKSLSARSHSARASARLSSLSAAAAPRRHALSAAPEGSASSPSADFASASVRPQFFSIKCAAARLPRRVARNRSSRGSSARPSVYLSMASLMLIFPPDRSNVLPASRFRSARSSGVDFMASIASRNSSSSNGFGTRSRPASSSYFEKPPTRTGFLDPAPSAPPLSALSSPGAASPETLVSAPASAPAAKASSSSSNG
mmetsp:Transcript_35877/g.75437  ORF Transcript_35877/g.75437 Transcript_35877/m.75437 type:complete len:268 (-) Transcript_35877:805-1608(-)